jgi:ribosomal protein L32
MIPKKQTAKRIHGSKKTNSNVEVDQENGSAKLPNRSKKRLFYAKQNFFKKIFRPGTLAAASI